jgi:hypothetical protein
LENQNHLFIEEWIWTRMSQEKPYVGFIWLFIYVLAACISLIPTSLLELRYFNQGVVILVLNWRWLFARDRGSNHWFRSSQFMFTVHFYLLSIHLGRWIDGTIYVLTIYKLLINEIWLNVQWVSTHIKAFHQWSCMRMI